MTEENKTPPPAEASPAEAELKAKYLTALADIENLKKRHAREKDEILMYSNGSLINALLPVIDNFQLALDAAQKHHPEAKAVLDGFGLLLPQFNQVLSAAGVETISPKPGDAFDPHAHESVGEAPSPTIPHHAILSLQRAGYRLHDRLLRPAMVLLSSGK